MSQGTPTAANTITSTTITYTCGCSFSLNNGNVRYLACGPAGKNHTQNKEVLLLANQIVNKMHEFQGVTG